LEEVSGLGGVMDSKWLTRLLKVVSLAVVVEAVVVLMAARTRLLRILNLGIWWWIKQQCVGGFWVVSLENYKTLFPFNILFSFCFNKQAQLRYIIVKIEVCGCGFKKICFIKYIFS
jgi:hypothetical protein